MRNVAMPSDGVGGGGPPPPGNPDGEDDSGRAPLKPDNR